MARADVSVTVQLKTTFVPVSEVFSTRRWITSRDLPDVQAVSQEYVMSATDDVAVGVRVAGFFIKADATLTTVPVEGTLELFGPGVGPFLGGRPFSVDIPNQASFVVTVLVTPDCFPVAPRTKSPNYSCVRTFRTSEELRPSLCPAGEAASAIECNGSFCDNIGLRCQAALATLTGCSSTAPIFEEKNNPYDAAVQTISCAVFAAVAPTATTRNSRCVASASASGGSAGARASASRYLDSKGARL